MHALSDIWLGDWYLWLSFMPAAAIHQPDCHQDPVLILRCVSHSVLMAWCQPLETDMSVSYAMDLPATIVKRVCDRTIPTNVNIFMMTLPCTGGEKFGVQMADVASGSKAHKSKGFTSGHAKGAEGLIV